MKPVTIERKLQNARETLDAVRHALDDFNAAASLSRQKTAVRNFVEQARSVTWTLQQLKSELSDEWDAWWPEATDELRTDPVAQYFYHLRNPVIKEGNLDIGTHASITSLALSSDQYPPNATGCAFGPQGLVWIMRDGTEVPMQTSIGVQRRWMYIAGMPEALSKQSLPLLMQRYFQVLLRIVVTAHHKFGLAEPVITDSE